MASEAAVAPEALPADTAAVSTPAPRVRRSRAALMVMALVVGLYGARWAQPILVPLVTAILAALVLAPAVRMLTHWFVPRIVAALLVVSAAIATIAGAGVLLAEPAAAWAERTPQAIVRLEREVSELREPLEAASEATEKLLNGRGSEARQPSPFASGASSVLSELVKQTPAMIATLIATVFLVFLLLAHGERLLRKCVAFAPGLSAKKDMVAGTREAQRDLSRYLLAITLINLALGAATAAVLQLLGVPDAVFWGCLAALMNFAPYVGAFVTAALLTLAGFVEHSTIGAALLVPGAFVVLNLIEGQFLTPLLVGRRLQLDPVAIVTALLVFGWLWGIAGVLLAVPLLTASRIVAQRIDAESHWARLVGDMQP